MKTILFHSKDDYLWEKTKQKQVGTYDFLINVESHYLVMITVSC